MAVHQRDQMVTDHQTDAGALHRAAFPAQAVKGLEELGNFFGRQAFPRVTHPEMNALSGHRVAPQLDRTAGAVVFDRIGQQIDDHLLEPQEIAELALLTTARLGAAAADGSLWRLPKLLVVLSAWQRLGDNGRAVKWLRAQTADDTRLLKVLNHFVSQGLAMQMGDGVSRKVTHVNLKSVETFFSLEVLVPRLRRLLRNSKWSEEQKKTIRLFVDAHDRRVAGKSDLFNGGE